MVDDGSPDETPKLEVIPDGARLKVVGELDAATGEILAEAGRTALATDGSTLRLDVADLRFCDSAGLRSLVLLSREVEGGLVLEHPSDMLVRLLEVTGLTDAFTLA